MPTAAGARRHVFGDLDPQTFRGVPPMLADSIPDRFGNALIDARLAREGVAPGAVTALDRLGYVGRRGMGALEFEPDTGPRDPEPATVELSTLVGAARAAVAGNLADEGAETGLHQLLAVGTSAGGARAKAVIAWDRATGEMRAGNIPVDSGFEQWVLKFDGVSPNQPAHLGSPAGYGRIEYAYSLMAREAGIDMAITHLLEEGGRAHFMSKRFDRDGASRLHMQSLCALGAVDFNLVGANEYASYIAHIDALGLGEAARVEAYRRMVFNVLASNNDDHSKNFSFLMDPAGTWSLAPAYDITFAYDPHNQWLSRHLMGVEGKFTGIGRRDLLAFASRFQIPGAGGVIGQVENALGAWPNYARRAGVPGDQRDAIGARLAQVRV
jgi:serine/threonine-protein kinase HipA